jgi:hypothetical protein
MNHPASARNVKPACEAVGTSSAFHPVDNFPAKGPCKINGYGVRRGPFHVFIGAILPSSLSDLGDRHEKMGNLGQIYRFRSRFISKSDRLFAALNSLRSTYAARLPALGFTLCCHLTVTQ